MKAVKSIKGIISNTLYYIRVWRKIFPVGLLFIFISVPVSILEIYSRIRIPQIIVSNVETGADLKSGINKIMLTFVIMLISSIVIKILETKIKTEGSRPMAWLYVVPVHKKLFKMKYQKLISPDVQQKLSKVENIAVRGRDGEQVHFFGMICVGLLTGITGIVFFTSDIVRVDPVLIVVVFISSIINLSYGIFSGNYSTKNMDERSDSEKKELYITKVMEDRRYAKDIRLYGLSEGIKSLFNKYHLEHSAYLRKENNVFIGGIVLNFTTIFFRDALAYIYLIRKLLLGNLIISEFVFLIMLILEFSKWMDSIVVNINELIVFSTKIQQIRNFVELEIPEDETGNLTADIVNEKPEIEFRNISFGYDEKSDNIIEDFNLKINSGEKLAIVGINGAGKTTLMHLLMGLLEPTKGCLLIDGIDRKDFIDREYFKLFSPMFQDITIFPESIEHNITGVKEVDRRKLQIVLEKSGLDKFINELEHKEKTKLVRDSGESAIDLSGGLNQRLLFARAVYKDALITILDEPTAALDPIAEGKMYREFEDISKNKTSIFISHRLASTRFCDRIILLENGKIIEEGSHDDLMILKGKYHHMYQVQSKYYQEGGIADVS